MSDFFTERVQRMTIAQVENYICWFNFKRSESNLLTECTNSCRHISAMPLVQDSSPHLVASVGCGYFRLLCTR